MGELVNTLTTALMLMNDYCTKTACADCLPRIEMGKCAFEEIEQIKNYLQGMGE